MLNLIDISSLNWSATCLASAVALWFLQLLVSLLLSKRCSHLLSSRFFSLPCLLLLAAGILGWNQDCYFHPAKFFRFGNELIWQHIDGLSSVFLILLSLIGLAVSLFSPGYLSHLQDRINSGHYWAALSAFMLSMALVVSSANALVFLVFWEVMSLSSLALVSSEHKHRRVQHASYIYLGATRIATAFLACGFLSMHSIAHSWNFSHWSISENNIVPTLLILTGLCIKAGIWPFHIWLPYAHPAAPAPVSALMSGFMIKVAIYAILRIVIFHNLCSPLIGNICLVLGLISAFWGILFALVQHDLKRLLAYSSVENVGLILMSIGLAIVAENAHFNEIAVLALSAAILHSFSHGLFKSLLFMGAGSIDATVHTRDLFHLGGLARKMPWTMGLFVFGCAAICALPPLNGFVSKWMLYQGLLQMAFHNASLLERSLGLASIGGMALVGGLAVACFSKACGIAFLGNARSKNVAEHAHEGSKGMIGAQFFLALPCLLIGLGAGLLSPYLQNLSGRILNVEASPVSYFNLPIPAIALCVFITFTLIYSLVLKSSIVRKYITWECGFGKLSPRTQGTAVSLAQPIAYLFGPLLKFKLLVEITGRDRRNFPEHIKVEPKMSSILEEGLYLPVIGWIQNFSRAIAKLQAGSVHLYLLYVCATLIILVLIGTRL